MSKQSIGWLAFATLLLLIGGCGMDLPSGVQVDRPRVLGVRVEIDAEPERAQPRPGDAVRLRWYVTGPDAAPAWTSAISACVAAPSFAGFPTCAGAPFAFALPGAPTVEPTFELTVPAADALGGDTLLIAGVLCANGTPTLPDEGLPTCEGEDATTELITFSLPLALGPEANHHPSWADEAFTIDGSPWSAPPGDLPTSDCGAVAGGPELPRLTVQDEETPSVVTFTSSPDDRETYQKLVLGETPTFVESREELVITHVATAGTFARLRTEVFDDDAPLPEVNWRHPLPEDVPAGGLTVRFTFVLRDQRGGMDRIERAACVVP